MRVWTAIFMGIAMFLTACEVPEEATSGAKPLPRLYSIPADQKATIQYRMLDSVNALRSAASLDAVSLNSRLNAASATHSRDMSLQNRPWHFGSDGSSPLDRVDRVGYGGIFLGETISETFETELETLSAWMTREDTRNVILDARADHIGFSWYQERSGKIWWTLITGMVREIKPLTDAELSALLEDEASDDS
jgi:uncharacterized protein YkwD